MLKCNGSGRLEIYTLKGIEYYGVILNLIDDTKQGKDRYSKKRLRPEVPLRVGERTDGIPNKVLAEKFKAECIENYMPVGSNTKFSDYSKHWYQMIEKDIDLATTTKESYGYRLRYITDFFTDSNDKPLIDITLENLNQFKYYLINDRGLSRRTSRDVCVLVKQIFIYAMDNRHIKNNPATAFKPPKKQPSKENDPIMTEDDLDLFFAGVKDITTDKNELIWYAYNIGFACCLRREEIAGLRWSAIRNGWLHIEHTVTKMATLQVRDETKTAASRRMFSITEPMQQLLDEIKGIQTHNKKVYGSRYIETDYIFTMGNGSPISPDYLTKTFRKVIDRSGLDKRLHLHSLRKTSASMMFKNGLSLVEVKECGGWSDTDTLLKIYAKVDRKNRTEIDRFNSKTLLRNSG